jgi:uncharacterized membrane protein YozB (DUF420 family)
VKRALNVFQIAQANLVLQIVILAILVTAYILKRRGKFLAHGIMMLAAVILTASSIILVMAPSLLGLIHVYRNYTLTTLAVIVGHAVLGGIVETLGIWIVVFWHLRPPSQSCAAKRRTMRATFIVWLVTLFLGILLFILLYPV